MTPHNNPSGVPESVNLTGTPIVRKERIMAKAIEVQPCREYAGEDVTSNVSNSTGFGKKKSAPNRL